MGPGFGRESGILCNLFPLYPLPMPEFCYLRRFLSLPMPSISIGRAKPIRVAGSGTAALEQKGTESFIGFDIFFGVR